MLYEFMKARGSEWWTGLAYAPTTNGRAESIVRRSKRAIGRVCIETGKEWDRVVGHVVFGHQICLLNSGISPFEILYNVKARLISVPIQRDADAFVTNPQTELLGLPTLERNAPMIRKKERGRGKHPKNSKWDNWC